MSDPMFTSETLDFYLREVAKAYKKLGGKEMPAEIVLIGGAAILAAYGFREMTYDVDAIITASSTFDEAIRKVEELYNLPVGWLNADFRRTKSFSPKLIQYSRYYKTFAGVLSVRTITGEYLVAMKLVSARQYKNDLSDIVGIIGEHQRQGTPLTYQQIDRAVRELYGTWDGIEPETRKLVERVLELPDAFALYEQYRSAEMEAKDLLVDFEKKYPRVLKESNLQEILEQARRKKAAAENKPNDE